MPKYYFPIFHRQHQPDQEGMELPDRHAAWEAATKTAGEILKDLDGKLTPDHEWCMTVEDEFGQKLFAIHINAEMK